MPGPNLFIESLKQNPVLVVLFIALDLMVISLSFQVFAEDVQVEMQINSIHGRLDQHDRQFTILTNRIELSSLQQQITSIESEIFQLDRLDRSGEANDRDLNRLDSLRSRLNILRREAQSINDR